MTVTDGHRLPKGILFDLGATILHQARYEPEAGFSRLLDISRNASEVPVEAFLRAGTRMAAGIETLRSDLAGAGFSFLELRIQSSLRLLVERFGLRFDLSLSEVELEYWKAASCMAPEPGVQMALDALEARGIPAGVVSNSIFSSAVLEWELQRHGLAQHFRFAMASSEYGVRKPHSDFFQAAARRLGVPPAEVWFIGDSRKADVLGASNAGLVPVWYARRAGTVARGDALRIDNWEEFRPLLDSCRTDRSAPAGTRG